MRLQSVLDVVIGHVEVSGLLRQGSGLLHGSGGRHRWWWSMQKKQTRRLESSPQRLYTARPRPARATTRPGFRCLPNVSSPASRAWRPYVSLRLRSGEHFHALANIQLLSALCIQALATRASWRRPQRFAIAPGPGCPGAPIASSSPTAVMLPRPSGSRFHSAGLLEGLGRRSSRVHATVLLEDWGPIRSGSDAGD